MKPLRLYVPSHALVALLILGSMGALTFLQGLGILFLTTLVASIIVTVFTPKGTP